MAPTHPRRQLRLRNRDYAAPGSYFVTICTLDKPDILGRIVGREMSLSPFGEVAASTWTWIGEHIAGVELDQCAIMPDHMHGILMLKPPVTPGVKEGAFTPDATRRKPLGGIIGAFKTRSTADVNRLRGTPGRAFWQRDFWDRVIRDTAELERIREYIRRNPASYRPRTYHV